MIDTVSDKLALGPLLRHVGETHATVWVQTQDRGEVTVRCGDVSATAPTFAVHGFHYALVVLDGLPKATHTPYTVEIDGEQVWPPADSPFPPSQIATLDPAKPTRLAFGSCRTASTHDEEGNDRHGVDALRAYAAGMLDDDSSGWPDLLAFLGDQVYADEEMSPEMIEFMKSRRDVEQDPGTEVKDYVEYNELYHRAWGDPLVRWVLSTIPSTMIFDDHDVRDDWNTSYSWRQEIRRTSWWAERITSALASYWVYQHAGNLSPAELAEDEIWQLITGHEGPGEVDITEPLDTFATRADEHPETYRWSYVRELGESRLVVVDSRAARKLDPEHRSILDEDEMAWFLDQLRGDIRHLFIGSSLPFLLPPGLHDFEAMNEAMAQRRYGKLVSAPAEQVRRVIDLEHWAAFNAGFEEVFERVMAVARGEVGRAPAMITFLGGDVHNSYLAEVIDPEQYGARSQIVQAVCSPMRNPMPQAVRVFMALFAKGLVRPMRAVRKFSKRTPDPKYPWQVARGPWFDNNLAVVEVDGPDLSFRWWTGEVVDGDLDHPRSRVVADLTVHSLRQADDGETVTGDG